MDDANVWPSWCQREGKRELRHRAVCDNRRIMRASRYQGAAFPNRGVIVYPAWEQ